jgi:hypothetical protein
MSPNVAQRQGEREAVAHHTNVRAGSRLLVTRDPFAGHVLDDAQGARRQTPGDRTSFARTGEPPSHRPGLTLRNFPSRPHGQSERCRASCRHVGSGAPIVVKELSGVRKRLMIVSMPTTGRPQQRDDHRLRDLAPGT